MRRRIIVAVLPIATLLLLALPVRAGDPECGNGVIEDGEGCDDGNREDWDGCTNECTIPFGFTCEGEPSRCRGANICGDGIQDPAEQCDDGADNSDLEPDGCRSDCRIAHCGDLVIDTGEECDDIASSLPSYVRDRTPNTCRSDCRLPWCGDGVVDEGERCDTGELLSNTVPGACRTDCTWPSCGDGVLDAGETCDLGPANGTSGSGCSIRCATFECGDGRRNPGEVCDDADADDNDYCLQSCVVSTCGDGFQDRSEVSGPSTDLEEVCDPLDVDGPLCREDCSQDLSLCGDGTTQQGEGCDEGDGNSDGPDAACRLDCQPRRCGDGIVDTAAGEHCDGDPSCGPSCTYRS